MTVNELNRTGVTRLSEATGRREAEAMMRLIWDSVKGWSQVDIIMHGQDEVSDFVAGKVEAIVGRVEAGEPLQYVIGEADFYGMRLRVTPDVLIPRPETAELVDIICDRYRDRRDLSVIDFCTGSGCIAIALARHLPFSHVIGEDISAAALDVARDNAARLRARVDFVEGDVLTLVAPSRPLYDIIVSNPPYIAMRERVSMDSRVTDHEPGIALFVPDDDPLRFYTPVARYAAEALREDGALFFEINPLFATDMERMLRTLFEHVELRLDSYGRMRFAIADTPLRD